MLDLMGFENRGQNELQVQGLWKKSFQYIKGYEKYIYLKLYIQARWKNKRFLYSPCLLESHNSFWKKKREKDSSRMAPTDQENEKILTSGSGKKLQKRKGIRNQKSVIFPYPFPLLSNHLLKEQQSKIPETPSKVPVLTFNPLRKTLLCMF